MPNNISSKNTNTYASTQSVNKTVSPKPATESTTSTGTSVKSSPESFATAKKTESKQVVDQAKYGNKMLERAISVNNVISGKASYDDIKNPLAGLANFRKDMIKSKVLDNVDKVTSHNVVDKSASLGYKAATEGLSAVSLNEAIGIDVNKSALQNTVSVAENAKGLIEDGNSIVKYAGKFETTLAENSGVIKGVGSATALLNLAGDIEKCVKDPSEENIKKVLDDVKLIGGDLEHVGELIAKNEKFAAQLTKTFEPLMTMLEPLKLEGKFVPGLNVCIAAVDVYTACKDISACCNKDNPTAKDIAIAVASGTQACASVAAATNIPVVSQVAAVVSVVAGGTKMAIENSDQIEKSFDSLDDYMSNNETLKSGDAAFYQAVDSFGDGINTVANMTSSAVKNSVDSGVKVANEAQKAVQTTYTAAKTEVKATYNAVQKQTQATYTAAKTEVKATYNAVQKQAQTTYTAAKTEVKATYDAVQKQAGDVYNQGADALNSVSTGFCSLAKSWGF